MAKVTTRDRMDQVAFGERLREIRSRELDMSMRVFIPHVKEVTGHVFDLRRLSMLEQGKSIPKAVEIAVVAAVDPQRRGILWAGWQLTKDPTLSAADPGGWLKPKTMKPKLAADVTPSRRRDGHRKRG